MNLNQVFQFGADFREFWYPKGIHNNNGLATSLKDSDIEVLYTNNADIDSYLKIENGHIQMIMTRFPAQSNNKLAFYNYTLANLFARLILTTDWYTKHHVQDTFMFISDSYYNDQLSYRKFKQYYFGNHKTYQNYLNKEKYLKAFTLGFLMPDKSFQPLQKIANDDLLCAEFNVDKTILEMRKQITATSKKELLHENQ